MAGVGKTALAVFAAHRLTDQYPDGQLFVDLHGFTENATTDPSVALGDLLRATGVPGEQIPTTLEAAATLWRSSIAGRRMLLLLDNVADLRQLEPLLPGRHGCMVIVTTQCRLSLDSTLTVTLEVLSAENAIELLISRSGGERPAGAARANYADVVERCGRLPLAISLAAARLKTRSGTIADLAAYLNESDERINLLGVADRSVNAVLSISYRHLSPVEQHLYRLLSHYPGHEIDARAAAAISGRGLHEAEGGLDGLYRVHLLMEHANGRYGFHDRVRRHAHTTSHAIDSDHARRSAFDRLLAYYNNTATAAMDLAYEPDGGRRNREDASDRQFADAGAAMRWLDAEVANLLAAAASAANNGREDFTTSLSRILHRHLRTRGRFNDAAVLHRQGLAAAQRLGDKAHEAAALSGLGWVHQRLGEYDPSRQKYSEALRVARSAGNMPGILEAAMGCGDAFYTSGRYDEAHHGFLLALQAAKLTGDQAGEVDALANLAWCLFAKGRLHDASCYFSASFQLAHEASYRIGQIKSMIGLGRGHQILGRHARAKECFIWALDAAKATGHRKSEAGALLCLGRTHLMEKRYRAAVRHLDDANETARSAGYRVGQVNALNGLAHVNRKRRRRRRAQSYYAEALAIGQELRNETWQIDSLLGLGHLYLQARRREMAESYFAQALAFASECGRAVDQACAHDGLANALRACKTGTDRQHLVSALNILVSLELGGVETTGGDQVTVDEIRTRLKIDDTKWSSRSRTPHP